MDENAYDILGISDGPAATPDEIKKVYRKLAIVKHPDKNRGNPNAAAEFAQIDAAYRLLLDPAARLALDDLLHARATRVARDSQMSDKRRKMREDLEAKEKRVFGERNEEETAKARLKVELERLRAKAEKEAMDRSRAVRRDPQRDPPQEAPPSSSSGPSGPSSMRIDERMEILTRTVKMTWDTSVRDWTAEELQKGLEAHGVVVENLFMSDKGQDKGRGRGRGVAKAVLGSRSHFTLALKASIGEGSGALSICPVLKETEKREGWQEGAGLMEEGGGEGAKRQKVGSIFPSPMLSAQDRPLFPLRGSQAQAPPSQSSAFPSTFPSSSFPITSTFPTTSFPKVSSFPSAAQKGESSGFEAQVIEKMRREAERKRALAEAEAEG